ncbi:unnamed protein product, partial [Didymodactylos carnosus]
MRISLFGQKNHVRPTKKQLQQLINKHQMKKFKIQMNEVQHNHLMDECSQKLKEIEIQYKHDNVKLGIRQNEFQAPVYLIDKIKESINKMIFETFTVTFETISHVPSSEEISDLKQLAQQHNCHVDKIDTKTEIKVLSIPKGLAAASHLVSKLTIEQSNAFCSSTLVFRKASVSTASIKIHLVRSSLTEIK